MLGALLKQVVGGLEEVPGEIVETYENQKGLIGRRAPQLSDIVKMLQTITSSKRTFICIDALDECAAEHRVKLLNSLNQILQESPGTRIFMTGRPHIQDEIGNRLSGRVKTVRIIPRRDDIIRYLRSKLDEDTVPDAMDGSLEADILNKIPEDISEMYVEATTFRKLPKLFTDRCISRFLLVSLNIDAILQETTIYHRRQKLNAMTHELGLGDAYDATMGRIKGQGGRKATLGIAALMWISHSERPLKPDELRHALAVEIGSPNFNTDNVPSIGTLLTCCQGLITMDKEGSTVRLVHFTLQEHLRVHLELFGTAHSVMTETCLSYLNSQQVKALSTRPHPDLRSTPFLEYSSLYWGVHAKRGLSDCAKLLALKLFNDYNNHISTKILLKTQGYPYSINFDKLFLFNGLHCASIFGIDEIAASLVELGGCDFNEKDCVGNTPLVWAAKNGHEGVVKILLGRGDVKPDKPDESYRTPLLWAAENGHEGVVKMLLGRDGVNPNGPNRNGYTPLLRAAWNGHEGVVKILLGRSDVNPDEPDRSGRTPLLWAAENGPEGMVKILLGRDDLNPNGPDRYGNTPLLRASRNGHEEAVKILLGRGDIIRDKPDKSGRTPLWWATKNGHAGVMALLQPPTSSPHSAA